MTIDEVREIADQRARMTLTIKELLVDRLDLPIDAEWITNDQPLFGRGLELDSVDALELAAGIDYEADVAITDDQVGVFGSVNRIVDYISQHQQEFLELEGAAGHLEGYAEMAVAITGGDDGEEARS